LIRKTHFFLSEKTKDLFEVFVVLERSKNKEEITNTKIKIDLGLLIYHYNKY